MFGEEAFKDKVFDQKILIVDDDRITTHILSGILENAGYKTLCAYDLTTAKRIVNNYALSLILLDVNLPDGNGLDFCANILQKQNMAGLPVLFISASDDHELKVRGFESGGVDYITKPLVGAEVLARVRTHLRLKMAYEQLSKLHAERIEKLTENQLSLLPDPEKMPQAGFFASVRQVLNAGGDFYDVVMHGEKVTDYVVSDASGHDLGSTIWTASFKTLWTEFSKLINTPSDICHMLNDSLLRILPPHVFFTCICARLNRSLGKLTLVSCGHTPAVFVKKGKSASLIEIEGDILGMFSDPFFGSIELDVGKGDRLFLYSDGLIEKEHNRDQGLIRLKMISSKLENVPLSEAVGTITDKMAEFTNTEDDIVLLAVEV